MALINRVARLFRADMHAILDRIEEPDTLLKQSIRDMEAQITHDAYQVKSLNTDLRQLLTRQTDLEQSLNGIREELDVCFDAENHDLAKALIKRKLECQQRLKYLNHQRQATEHAIEDYSARLEEQREKLSTIQQKVALLAPDQPNDVQNRQDCHWDTACTVHKEDVEVAFLRELNKRRGT